MGGGKRIRPRIVLATGSALGVAESTQDALAIALELIHTYTLIHDDLPCMDNDDFRRGRPTNHRQFGEATALLAGDALIPLAFEAIAKIQDPAAPPTALRRAIVALARASGGPGVIAGQLDETEFDTASTLDDLLDVFRKKTGALFGLAFELPALFSSRLDETALQSLHATGESIGVAFQIADDLEDAHPALNVPHPRHHVRAHLTDAESVGWIDREREKALGRVPPELRGLVDSLYSEIREKCLKNA